MASKPRSPSRATTPLVERIARASWPAPSADARVKVRNWLREIASRTTADALARVLLEYQHADALLHAIADGSPYLWDMIAASPERWLDLLQSEPETHFAALLADTERLSAEAAGDSDVMRALRLMKAEASLLIAAADIGGAWDVARVTRALTDVADTAVATAVRHLIRKSAPGGAAQSEKDSGYVVLALGKMGAHELNYSSDIDLIVFYDPDSKLCGGAEPSPFFVRLTRGLVKLLQERTADGYVFRVDLRLRPDPASTQIAVSIPAALDYYERSGQNWERAAMIKARPCAGDIAAGEAVLKSLSPFVWRKHLDFVALADVHAMKQQIHVYRGHGDIAVEGHNIKLGRGGIREIEFFVQTQQLIAGGRHTELRGRQTLAMLAQLAQGGWIREDARAELEAAYNFLRTVEHRLQMVADEQTQTLPAERDALERFARFLAFEDRDAFARILLGHLGNVQRHYAALFETAPDVPGVGRVQVTAEDAAVTSNIQYFAERGFAKPADAAGAVQRWFAGSYRSLKGDLARSHLAELLPLFVDHAVRSENPDATFVALDRFLEALHGGARLYSLLRQNRDLVALLATILGTAPRLAEILAQQPEAMDAVLDPAFFGALPDDIQLQQAFAASLGQADTYEDFLDRSRQFGREHMFLIGVRVISGTITAAQAGQAFARLADVLIRALLNAAEQRFAADHGRLFGQEVALLALGKLGGREMTAGSDLDLILIYDFDPEHPMSDGARSLAGSQYFARLTQRLINTLTAPTNYGRLYEVDMRLRPSGRSGPLATSRESFELYQKNDAWTWEHMALTRARVLAASPTFRARVEAIIRDVLCQPRDPVTLAGDVVEMREAVAAERGDDTRWNLRDAAGGLLDIEFITQYLQLAHAHATPELLDTSTARVLDKAARLGLLAPEDAEVLRPAVRLYHDLTQLLRLCVSGPFEPKTAGAGLLRLLARAADLPDFAALDGHVEDTQARVRATFDRLLRPPPAEG